MNRIRKFLRNYRSALIAWCLIIALISVGVHYRIDKNIVAVAVLLVGILGQAFAALVAWIGLVPVVGPIIAHVLSLPFLWLLNGIGYLVSIVAIRRGYSKDVLNHRVITVTLLTGITIGYVLGKLI
jgi:CHASE2 domain-containing sensor protein